MNPNLKFIGYIETPYENIRDCPRNIQLDGPGCKLVLNKEYEAGLNGIVAGQEILILYWFDNVDRMLQKIFQFIS